MRRILIVVLLFLPMISALPVTMEVDYVRVYQKPTEQ